MTQPPPSRPRRGRLPGWALLLGGAIILSLVITLATLAVLGPLGGGRGSRGATTRLTVDDDRIAFEIKVPAGTAITGFSVAPVRDCPTVSVGFSDHGLRAYAVAKSCAPRGNSRPGNGNHGSYRTLADVSDPLAPIRLETGLGRAEVFGQRYFECTNSCRNFVEPVAIITVDEPVDPGYPTLVLISTKGELSREAFTGIVRTLTHPVR